MTSSSDKQDKTKVQVLDVSRLEDLFHTLDANKDGRIDPDELTDGLLKLGYDHVTKEQIKVEDLWKENKCRYSIINIMCFSIPA